jgi:AmmeMemoRadiSam system protein A/AmmeMemoRadiSam system protein B
MSLLGTFIVPHPPLIIPSVGRGQEDRIQKTIDSYDRVGRTVADLAPQTVVIVSPHAIMYADYIHISPGTGASGDFGQYGAKNVSFREQYDTAFVQELSEEAERCGIPAGTLGERDASLDHGVMIPLYFIEKYDHDFQIVRIGISGVDLLTQYRFGQAIARVANALDRKIVLVASGDLSHKLTKDGPYGFTPEGPEFDEAVTKAMADADFMQFLTFDSSFTDAAAECGLRSFVQMAGALDGLSVKPELLSYEGPYGVGYAVCIFTITGKDENRNFGDRYEAVMERRFEKIREQEDPYVGLARQTLESYVQTGRVPTHPMGVTEEMRTQRAGVFVSIKKDGRLRGCIGTIEATQDSVAEEIIRNAVEAGTQDPRFHPVRADELDALIYSVDVLGKAESVDSVDELDAKRYGVIVTKGYKRGLLLPNLDGVDTPEEQIAIALQKAGIPKNESYQLERFEVVRHI